MNQINQYNETIFESIKHTNEYDKEYWYARELQVVLEYKRWDKFCNVIESAKTACEKSNYGVTDHFVQVGKMVKIGSKTSRNIMDYKLSRYACYLIVQNADSRKQVVALGQMTTNINQLDLLCFKGKIKNKLFNSNLTGKGNIDYNLNVIISINI